MGKAPLRHGYTTGACAAAAARGSALMLREQRRIEETEIMLPGGERASFRLQEQKFTEKAASCSVVKDAGDDPDVTNGATIHAMVELIAPASTFPSPNSGMGTARIVIKGGIGIGKVTKPGLALPPGEWAINPVPRQMITSSVREVFPVHGSQLTVHVTISIPDGEELARKTLNERLGIVGGLSILGTTGIVKPLSAQAWTDTIDSAIDVALACGSKTVVLSTGRSSELAAEKFLKRISANEDILPFQVGMYPEEAFVMMGDFFGHAIEACTRKGVSRVIIAGQFAKLLKIACGHRQTHVNSSQLDLKTLASWLAGEKRTAHLATVAKSSNTARQLLVASDNLEAMVEMVCDRVRLSAGNISTLPDVKVLLAGYNGEVLYFG